MAVAVIKKAPANLILENEMTPAKQVKVRVSDRWSVVHDDKRHVEGDELTVPESTADEWERNCWVERVGSSKA
jgi:hypothetical protein